MYNERSVSVYAQITINAYGIKKKKRHEYVNLQMNLNFLHHVMISKAQS